MNLLTKFRENRTINVASIVKNAPPLGSHVFKANTNLLTKFHEDWTINVASRVFTRKNAPPLGSHIFQANVTIFKLIQDNIQTNLLTKSHEDWTINVASRVLTRKTAPPPGGLFFPPIWTIFELFHDDWAKIVTSRVNTALPPGSHTNILTKLHEDWASNVTSTLFTSFKLSKMLTAHDRQKAIKKAHHEHSQNIIGTNLLTKFLKDRKINVASRVLTRKNAPIPGSHVFQPTGIIF
ncbi:hypothetical protein DPMN_024447 [Dreissena polymorpha]|uniref:Uncharacterized protein n=1 Tax=Dreissena polymorpha TaxID=45954 RepID=A0A9D4LMK5_DREPO|nr:hypothetical protein DPMN_024447 [Dreissena polymorpha]